MPARARPPGLPDFGNPPVTEVVLSIQFETLTKFENVHVGLLWQQYSTEYPSVSEHSPLSPQFETFGTPRRSLPPFQIETFYSPPMARFWFTDASDVHLIQVQQDRLLHNWRKRPDAEEYPRYESIRDRFEAEIAKFTSFLDSEELGVLRITQCEVTYINTITLPDGADPHRNLQRITPLWTWDNVTEYPLEGVTIGCRAIISAAEKPIGRVHVSFTPVVRQADLIPAIQLDITARAKPNAPDLAAAFDLLDEERNSIVKMFAAVTTSEMHTLWGRTDAGAS
jgi:uncharacterized protein (TIGR04255 family)